MSFMQRVQSEQRAEFKEAWGQVSGAAANDDGRLPSHVSAAVFVRVLEALGCGTTAISRARLPAAPAVLRAITANEDVSFERGMGAWMALTHAYDGPVCSVCGSIAASPLPGNQLRHECEREGERGRCSVFCDAAGKEPITAAGIQSGVRAVVAFMGDPILSRSIESIEAACVAELRCRGLDPAAGVSIDQAQAALGQALWQ